MSNELSVKSVCSVIPESSSVDDAEGKSKRRIEKMEKGKEEVTMKVDRGKMHKENMQKKINEQVRMVLSFMQLRPQPTIHSSHHCQRRADGTLVPG